MDGMKEFINSAPSEYSPIVLLEESKEYIINQFKKSMEGKNKLVEIDENKENIVLKAINEAINNRHGRLAFSSDETDDVLLSEIDHLSKAQSEMTAVIISRKIRQASVLVKNQVTKILDQMVYVTTPDEAIHHLEVIGRDVDPLITELKEILTEAANLK